MIRETKLRKDDLQAAVQDLWSHREVWRLY